MSHLRTSRATTRRIASALVALVAVVALAGCTERVGPSAEARAGDLPSSPTTSVAPGHDTSTTTTGRTTTGSTTSTSTTSTSTTSTSTTSTSTTSTSTTTTSEPARPRRITMAFTGDILPHSPLWRQAGRNAAAAGVEGYDFAPMLAGLRTVHDGVDLAVCHLETPITPVGEEHSTMPRYGVPAEIALAIAAAGFDRCSTASNHAADRGVAGIERTVDVLEAAGVTQAGMARHPAEIEPSVVDVAGVAVAHLSYTWSYNGLSLPEGQEWRSALIDPDRILADTLRARELGAEVVVASLHWGAEGVHAPTSYQREVAERITAAGTIDLVVGHHAHVLQPIEQVNGTWVLFGLGNVLSNLPTSDRWPAASQDAAIVTVALEVGPDGVVEVEAPVARATWVDKDAGWIVRIVDAELARDDLGAGQRGRLEASWNRTAAVLGGHLVAPREPER